MFSAKQRAFFHAAAARGQKGMHALADEADKLKKEDHERPPVHEAHGGTCMSCGGPVDGDGKYMSEGGAVEKESYDDESEEYGDAYDDKGRGYSRVEAPEARSRFARAAKERR